MDTRRRLLDAILRHRGRLLTALVASLVVAATELGMGKLLSWFVSAAQGIPVKIPFVVLTGKNATWHTLLIITALVVLITLPKAVFLYISTYMVASVTNRLGADVRSQMYAHLQTLPMKFFNTSRIGDLMSRMSNDVAVIQQSSQVVVQAISGPTMVVVGLAGMFRYSWEMSLLTLVCIPPMAIALDRISKKIKLLTRITQESLGDVSSTVEETVRGVRIIKTFCMEDEEVVKFNGINNTSLNAALKAAKRSSYVVPVAEIMGGAAAALIILVGGYMIVHRGMSFSDLTGFTYLSFMVASAGKQFGKLNVTYQQVMAAGERIYGIIDTKSDLMEKPDAKTIKKPLGKVEFKNVSFEYVKGEVVLDNLSMVLNPGQIVAIVGPSGAGKSTIADLIPRFYDVTEGSILVDNIDVRDLKVNSLRGLMAMVPQETILFSGTVAQNIKYGKPDASMGEVIEAAKSANAHEFILSQPDGYQTVLGEAGIGLSGGQRQRIAIARALLKNPAILILDEATSSLDAASESAVQDALDRLMKGRSTLVIAHRLSTVRNADKIVVLDQGRVVETGTFESLVNSGGVFSDLYQSQYQEQEISDVGQ